MIVQVPGSSSPTSTIVAFSIAISAHIAPRSSAPSMTVTAIVAADRSTLTESRTAQGAIPEYQLTLTTTRRPSIDACSVCGATGWGFNRPGLGITIAGCPAAGSTGVAPAGGGPTPVPGSPIEPLPDPSSLEPPPATGSSGVVDGADGVASGGVEVGAG